MYLMDITPYTLPLPNGEVFEFVIKDALLNAGLFSPEIARAGIHNGKTVVHAYTLATKIENTEGHYLVLEDAEYDLLKKGLDIYTRWGRADMEFHKRFYEAEKLSLKELNKKLDTLVSLIPQSE